MLYRYRAGIPCRDLPERFGDFRVVHLRHSRWSKTGVRERILNTLSLDSDSEYVMIDSTIVRAHQHSSGAKGASEEQAIGRSRGGLSTKIHTTVDALFNPTGFHLTPGRAHDLEGADVQLKDTEAQAVLADTAYDAQARVIDPLLKAGKTIAIPPRATRADPRDYDRHVYEARHLIESFFARLKQYRCIATRYDNLARNFLGAVHLGGAVVWLN